MAKYRAFTAYHPLYHETYYVIQKDHLLMGWIDILTTWDKEDWIETIKGLRMSGKIVTKE